MTDRCPQRDVHIVLGDFSGVSGCGRVGYKMSVGPLGSGADAGYKNNCGQIISDPVVVHEQWAE